MGLSRVKVLFIWPYSYWFCRMCRAYADWGLLYLMYRTCSWKRMFRLRLVWPIYICGKIYVNVAHFLFLLSCGVVWYGLFYVLSDVLVYVLLWVGSRFVGRCEGLLPILFFVVLFRVVAKTRNGQHLHTFPHKYARSQTYSEKQT